MIATEGVWLSINDYSHHKNVSISTIRRHIKTNILKHKEENGKYFIYVPSSENLSLREDEDLLRLKLELQLLRTQNKKLKEENNELKMLVDIYENNKQSKQDSPPEVPFSI